MTKITLEGNIVKITRVSGKALAQVMLTIPASKSGDIPLEGVRITIEPTQSSMFDGEPRGAVRGNKG